MKNHFVNIVIISFLLSGTFPFEGNCMYQQDEELDYSGPSLLTQRGKRLSSSKTTLPNVLTVEDLFKELEEEDLSRVTKLDLSKNYITDDGIPTIVNFVTKKLPDLKILDLSLNKITENATKFFTDLLINNEFEYLDIVGTGGASSIDGIRNLILELEQKSLFSQLSSYERNQKISIYISKVIWIPEVWLEGENTKKNVPQTQLDSHKMYYKTYKK